MEKEWKPCNIDWLWFLLILIFPYTTVSFPLNPALCAAYILYLAPSSLSEALCLPTLWLSLRCTSVGARHRP